jgi:hypothetical protein
MSSVFTTAHTVEHYIGIIAIGGHFGAQARSARHYTTVVASNRTRGGLRDDCPFNEVRIKLDKTIPYNEIIDNCQWV